MPRFSNTSLTRLSTCDAKLQVLFCEVVKGFDCAVICGHRGEAEQNAANEAGKSKVRWPNSKHNALPSKAVDVVPYPIDWNDRERFHYFAGYVKGVAASLGIGIKWGGDWNGDTQVRDNTFDDLPHFELEGSNGRH